MIPVELAIEDQMEVILFLTKRYIKSPSADEFVDNYYSLLGKIHAFNVISDGPGFVGMLIFVTFGSTSGIVLEKAYNKDNKYTPLKVRGEWSDCCEGE